MNNNKLFGKCLKAQRLQKCLTQKNLAEKLGISYQMYQQYEYGLYRPRPQRMKKIAEILGMNFSRIITHFYLA